MVRAAQSLSTVAFSRAWKHVGLSIQISEQSIIQTALGYVSLNACGWFCRRMSFDEELHADKHYFNPFVEHPCDGTDTCLATTVSLGGLVKEKMVGT